MKTKLCVEGGGHKALNRECRRGFVEFLCKAGVDPDTVEVEACGPRGDAYKTFRAEHLRGRPAILLVDAEGPVTAPSPWQHLEGSDRWNRPTGAGDDRCHLMVQVMESWFLSDINALESFYGEGFRTQSLPKNPNVELVPKQHAIDGLDRAAGNTGRGGYNKGRDSFKILARLDPAKVVAASSHAKRWIGTLSAN